LTSPSHAPGRGRIAALLFDADGTLFPSEQPAFEASAGVTNAFLRSVGASRSYTADELRRTTTGLTFRSTAAKLALDEGVDVAADTLQAWVEEEVRVVTAHLCDVLRPDPVVHRTVANVASRFSLAVVTSSARPRLDGCLDAVDLSRLFPASSRFSAESSLPRPTTKPDPAIYFFALERLGLGGHEAIAIEDSVAGVTAAVAAGIDTFGILAFTPEDECPKRAAQLVDAGASVVAGSWSELDALLAEVEVPVPSSGLQQW
jgi:HAD superfamily hydrolase (TIGR01509 family)